MKMGVRAVICVAVIVWMAIPGIGAESEGDLVPSLGFNSGTIEYIDGVLVCNPRMPGGANDPASGSSLPYVNIDPTSGGSTYSAPAVIPEPATLTLLALGGLTVLRRRRRRS